MADCRLVPNLRNGVRLRGGLSLRLRRRRAERKSAQGQHLNRYRGESHGWYSDAESGDGVRLRWY